MMAEALGHAHIVCEVNAQPPNPISDAFHANHGFEQVETATIDDDSETVRYALKHRSWIRGRTRRQTA
jgi:uncharacterized protein